MKAVETLLAVSVWADLRFGVSQLTLLASIGARVGLASILVAEDGPLAPPSADVIRLGDEIASSIPVLRRTWPARASFGAVPARSKRSVDVAVSVGRTDAEATARAIRDPFFRQYADDVDMVLVGRLEDVQQKVAQLAASNVREVCCLLPQEDLVDHLAQISSIAVGTLETHYPGSPRSADPLPPTGWGGPRRAATER